MASPGFKQAKKTAAFACDPEWGWTLAQEAPNNFFNLSMAKFSTLSTTSHPP